LLPGSFHMIVVVWLSATPGFHPQTSRKGSSSCQRLRQRLWAWPSWARIRPVVPP
jgi:hypothetical protein